MVSPKRASPGSSEVGSDILTAAFFRKQQDPPGRQRRSGDTRRHQDSPGQRLQQQLSRLTLPSFCSFLQNKEKERLKEREREAREREARSSNGHLFTSLTVSSTTLCSSCNRSITAKEALSCPGQHTHGNEMSTIQLFPKLLRDHVSCWKIKAFL